MQPKDVVVASPAGSVRGASRGGVAVFRGVPYAEAPEGPLRFRAPARRAVWEGVLDGTAFGAAPPQLPPAPGAPPVWRPEAGLDCLSLNVWSPDLGAAGLPVMVWIHGGLWKYGASSMPQYDGAALASAGVVVVSLNYRVGFEGFGHLPGCPDNRGLLDQVAALEWVRDNIAAYGGDPDDVTVFGQSAGAASVTLLMSAAPGLFRRAIAQSVPAGLRATDEAAGITAAIAAAAGVEPTREGFAALPPEAILAVQDAPLGPADGPTAFGPVEDGTAVTGPVWEAAAGAPDVDLVCGFTREESLGMGPPGPVDLTAAVARMGLDPSTADAYREAYPGRTDTEVFSELLSDTLVRVPTTRVAESHARAGGRTWLYDFAWRGAGHGSDVPIVFGTLGTRYAERFLGSPPAPEFGPLSERVRAAWTGFAATGDPGWPRFDLAARRVRVWDTTPSDVPYPLEGARSLWRS
jgi:carboxylesterase type B